MPTHIYIYIYIHIYIYIYIYEEKNDLCGYVLQKEVQKITVLMQFCIFKRSLSVVEILLAAVINQEVIWRYDLIIWLSLCDIAILMFIGHLQSVRRFPCIFLTVVGFHIGSEPPLFSFMSPYAWHWWRHDIKHFPYYCAFVTREIAITDS